MKLFAATTLTLACALAAGAQTLSSKVPGLKLSGNPMNPRIENHSGKPVLWVGRWFTNSMGQERGAGRWFIGFNDKAGGLMDGDSAEVETSRRGRATIKTSITITAAIFADGEFKGAEKAPLRHDVEITFQLMKEAWRLAQAKEWDKLQAMADKADDGIYPQMTARKLLQARGNDKELADLDYIGKLPISTWEASPLINRIPGFQILAQWFMPLVADAQGTDYCTLPATCPAFGPYITWPQPSGYTWNCNDTFGSHCPGDIPPPPHIPNQGPFIGVAAYCTAAQVNMGVQAALSQDYYPGGMGMSAHRMNPNIYSYELGQSGSCGTSTLPGLEQYDYRNYCPNDVPYVYGDSTGTYCGVVACGYGGAGHCY